jgi:hypothetical protein
MAWRGLKPDLDIQRHDAFILLILRYQSPEASEWKEIRPLLFAGHTGLVVAPEFIDGAPHFHQGHRVTGQGFQSCDLYGRNSAGSRVDDTDGA